MMQQIPMEADHVIGVRVSGKIGRQDMDVMIEVMKKMFEKHERISIYVEVESFGWISLPALVDDLKFALPNFKKFVKKAVVSKIKWMEKWTDVADHLFPSIEVKHFLPEQKEAALKWIQEY